MNDVDSLNCHYRRGLAIALLYTGIGTTVEASSILSEDVASDQPRRLQEDDACTEDGLFVESDISDKGIPIGGCYQNSNLATNGFSSYVLDGGNLTAGKMWLYVDEGTWNIGVVEGGDDSVVGVDSTNEICTSDALASSLSGPTDSGLRGSWTCDYFQGGITNYNITDFREVECGCEGKALSDGDSGGGDFGRIEIAATVLAVLAVLLILVCGTFCYTRRRKRTTTPWLEQEEEEDEDIAKP